MTDVPFGGTARLNEAVAAYLGIALTVLGERESGMARARGWRFSPSRGFFMVGFG